nr:LuxR family transcriptional regulator [Streptomyces sp. ODS05-4]
MTLAAQKGLTAKRATASSAAGLVPLGAIAHLLPPGVDLSDPARGFAAVASALDSRRNRWVVFVDDLHLLDAASALLLRQLMTARVVWLIGTMRTGEPVSEAVRSLINEERVQHHVLGELDLPQTEQVLHTALGAPVSRRTVAALFDASRGNMLYLRELVLGALTADSLRQEGSVWELAEGRPLGSARLSELIDSRLATVLPRARALLESLALCGVLPLADAHAIASSETVCDLERSGVIAVHVDGLRRHVEFTHPLYGEVLRNSLPALLRRARLKEQVARIKATGARRHDDPLHIATWSLAATGTADPDLLMRAALLARHAHDYHHAVSLLEALPVEHRTIGSQLLLGDCRFELGSPQRAEAALAEAADLAVTDQEKLAVAFTRAMSLFWAGNSTAQALAVIAEASDVLVGTDELLMLRVCEGALRAISGQPSEALTLLADLEGMEVGPAEVTHPGIWAVGAMMRPAARALTGSALRAVEDAEHAYELHQRVDAEALILHPAGQLISLVLALAEAGRLPEARETGNRAWDALGQVLNPVTSIWLAYHQAHTEWLAGRVRTAHRWYTECAAQSRTHGNERALRLALSGLAAANAMLGDLGAAETAEKQAQGSPVMGYRAGEEVLGAAWLFAAQGHLTQARAVLSEGIETARAGGCLASEALLLTDMARLGGAREAAGRLAELATACEGDLGRARAMLACALAAGEPEQLMDAAEELEQLGADLLCAEAATVAASAWQRREQSRKASMALQSAHSYLSRCEGARTPLLTSTTVSTVPLTPREQEIALLAATGTASKDIADALGLSVRTVNNHLHHVYGKLGITTRRELADHLKVPHVGE